MSIVFDGGEFPLYLGAVRVMSSAREPRKITRTSSLSSMLALMYVPGRPPTATCQVLVALMEVVMKTESIPMAREADSSFSIVPHSLRPSAQKRPSRDSSHFSLTVMMDSSAIFFSWWVSCVMSWGAKASRLWSCSSPSLIVTPRPVLGRGEGIF